MSKGKTFAAARAAAKEAAGTGCVICDHEERAAIEAARAEGDSMAEIGRTLVEIGAMKPASQRHITEKVSEHFRFHVRIGEEA